MNIASRVAAWSRPTARDYVQDGLVYQLDCLENTGYGSFSNSTTTWKNLKSDGNDSILSALSSTLYWTSNGLVVNGQTNTSSNVLIPNGVFNATIRTIEFVCKITSLSRYGRFITSNRDEDNQSTNGCVCIIWGNTGYSPSTNISFRLGAGQLNMPLTITVNEKLSICFTCSSITDFKAYVNNQESTEPTYNNFGSVLNKDAEVAFPANISVNKVDEIVYSLRLYDKKISDIERSHNYAVDKARFGLT